VLYASSNIDIQKDGCFVWCSLILGQVYKQDICGHLYLSLSIDIINPPLQLANKMNAKFLKKNCNVVEE